MHELSADTQALLLLCGRFDRAQRDAIQPLDLKDYNALAAWLAERNLHPADLLTLSESDLQDPELPIEPSRLQALLGRGTAMALAVEGWTSRGLWVLSRSDEEYPTQLQQLGRHAPPLIYGAGDVSLLSGDGPALAIVGSRDVDETAREFTQRVAHAAGRQGVQVVSGGARGVDSEAMWATLDAGGVAVGLLAENLARAAVAGRNGAALMDGELVFLSPYDPASGFNVGNAMGRNKYIYALADAGLVVSAAEGSGGTWNGAVEALKRGTTPVFVRVQEGAPAGNLRLLEEGASVFLEEVLDDIPGWLSNTKQPPEPADPEARQAQLW
jgi:predicted Rossmann fold nucleotide-binding protein DprA/Smf involved in DNA uptake